MRELSSRNVDVSDRAQAELKNARKRIDELNAEMNRLISQVTDTECCTVQGSFPLLPECPEFLISFSRRGKSVLQ